MGKISSKYPIPESMTNIIDAHTVGLGAVGVIGGVIGPGADLPVIAVSWVTMTVQLAAEAGLELDKESAKKLCIAVATGAGIFLSGTKIAATVGAWLTAALTFGVSLAVSAIGNAALNAAFTRAYGRACARYFLQTDQIESLQVVVGMLITLIGLDMGIDMGNHDRII